MVILGAGRVGAALARAAEAAGQPWWLVDRDRGWQAVDGLPGDPILLTVRNDDLDEVIARVPRRRRDDLVFVQNGMLRPWLREHALAGCTRGLLFFAVKDRAAPIEPGPDSPFCGPHALTVARWLVACGVPAEAVDWARFTAAEHEKLVWNAAFGLMCQARGATVGQVCEAHLGELRALVAELNRVAGISMGFDVEPEALLGQLVAYSRSIPDYRGAVKEWRWRNGWFVDTAARYRIPMPVHAALCAEAGVGAG